VASALVCWGRLTEEQRAIAYRDARSVVEAINAGAPTRTAGELRTKLDWEVDRFARAMAALHAEGINLFNFRVSTG
jgi:hypothetical protein